MTTILDWWNAIGTLVMLGVLFTTIKLLKKDARTQAKIQTRLDDLERQVQEFERRFLP